MRTLDRALHHVLGTADRRDWLAFPALGDRGLVYCPIPKCASSAVKYWLVHAAEGGYPTLSRGGIHGYARERCGLGSLPPRRARRVLRSARTLVVLRDPVARVASAYLAKLVRFSGLELAAKRIIEGVARLDHPKPPPVDTTIEVIEGDSRRAVPASSRIDYTRGVSFRDLVRYLETTSDEDLDPHLRPQVSFTGGRRFDTTVRQESLNRDLARLGAELGIEAPLPNPPGPAPVGSMLPGELADVPSGELRGRIPVPVPEQLLDPEIGAVLRRRYDADVRLLAPHADRLGKRPVSGPLR